MARKDDEYEDDAPRKPKRRNDDDEFEDRPRKARRRDEDDDEIDDRPRKKARRRDEDDDYDSPSRKPKAKSKLPMILGILAAVFLLVCGGGAFGLYWIASKGKDKFLDAVSSSQTQNDMRQIGLAMSNYTNVNGGFPTNSFDATGKPLLSWRVHILPFINEEALYRQFKLDEPWDSPNNKPLLSRIPRVYLSSAEAMGRAPKGTKTYFRSFSSAGAVMDPKFRQKGPLGSEIGATIRQIEDGSSNTILVVESGEAIEWTKPDDITWAGGGSLPPLGGDQKNPAKFWMIFADGSIRAVDKTLTPDQLKAAITIAGKEMVDLP